MTARPTARAHSRSASLIAAVFLSAALISGCGSSVAPSASVAASPSAAAAAAAAAGSLQASDACPLVPDMDALVGKTVLVAPTDYRTGPLSRCTWVYGKDPTRNVALNFGPVTGHTDSIANFGPGESVPGLGDDARWWPGTRTLSVAVGPRSFQINLELDQADVSKELAVKIAQSALAHLT